MQLPVQAPMFALTGPQKEPARISRPIPASTFFIEHDFLVQSPATAPPSQNGTQLAPPTGVTATTAAVGGTVLAGVYQVAVGYSNAAGQTPPGPAQAIATTGATSVINAASPPPQGNATGYRLYVSAAGGTTLFLQGTTVPIGTGATLIAPPSTTTAAPTNNSTGINPPVIPVLTAGGTTGPAPRTEFWQTTYVDPNGETLPSPEATITLAQGQLTTVTSPAALGDATGYNVYAATASGQEVKQNALPIPLGTSYTENPGGVVLPGVQRAGVNQPGLINNQAAILGLADHDYNAGYVGPVGGPTPGAPISDAFGRPNFNQSVFGATEGYPFFSTEPGNAHILAASSIEVEISLLQAWDPGMMGQLVGLNIDPASNFFIADLSLSNVVARISNTADGPGRGGPGDTYKRIKIKVLPQYTAA